LKTIKVKVKLLGHLATEYGRNELELEVPEGSTLRQLLIKLRSVSQIFHDVVTEKGETTVSYLVFINGVDAELLEGYDTVLKNGTEILLLPVAHGG
jgi:molybdopterin synthase sulfur carrier subunit